MDCRECSSEMTAFLDGELSQPRRNEVRSHIDGCRTCARELAGMREAADFVHAHYRQLEPHPAGWSRVQVQLDSSGSPPRRGWLVHGFLRWQPVAIALTGFGLTIGLWSYQRHLESRRALEHYMTQYVQFREAQEESHRRQAVQRPGGRITDPDMPGSGNPFLLVHETTRSNPFRK